MGSAVDVASVNRQFFDVANFSQIERHDGGFAFNADAPHAAAFSGGVVTQHIDVAGVDAFDRFNLGSVKKKKIQNGSFRNRVGHRSVLARSPRLGCHLYLSLRNRANRQ